MIEVQSFSECCVGTASEGVNLNRHNRRRVRAPRCDSDS